jgi:hypothetical protein
MQEIVSELLDCLLTNNYESGPVFISNLLHKALTDPIDHMGLNISNGKQNRNNLFSLGIGYYC